MTKFLFLFFFVFVGKFSQAQTFDEWFNQKKTQRNYLLQQIAALRVYSGYVQKGYAIAQEGLTLIGEIKKGDFDLHRNYLGSLKGVNQEVGSSPKPADVMAMHGKIRKLCKCISKQVRQEKVFSGEETSFITNVLNNIQKDGDATLTELIFVVTSGNLQMKDDERLLRIDAIHSSMQKAYEFVRNLEAEINLLAFQRQKEANEVQVMNTIHNLKKD